MIRVEPPVVNWQSISEFPKYEMNQAGEVRNADSGIRIQPMIIGSVNYVELFREGKPYLMHVDRLRWKTFPTGANPPLFSDIERHGNWLKDQERYEDGEKSHLCGMICSVGEV